MKSSAPPSDRPLRADARRNRDALLATAREAFAAGELDVRIEEIARRAGVGVGTLYRHFETREAMIEAVYRQEIELLCGSAAALLEALPPDEALTAFLERLVDHVVKHLGLAAALAAVMASASPAFAHGNQKLLEAVALLMDAAAAAGQIRADVKPETVLMALGGLCTARGQPGWEEGARGVIGLLVDGLRFGVGSGAKGAVSAPGAKGAAVASGVERAAGAPRRKRVAVRRG
ncbi:TetR/AcrR family transcriptional regulator [Chondromyces crocatus]|uniref:TetR/AcrR family transcriptional regulator n=1 Tax=Chondromyces crocatus TaxID=52 RepID=UPI001FE06C88|nr:TetR/AcrR family transcriptional regulator [Chondromyces crocatus]